MHLAIGFLIVVSVTAAQWVGVRYGWGYHAAILVVMGALMPLLIRLPLSILPRHEFDPSVFDTPQGRELGEKVAALAAESQRLNRMLRVDAFVFPLLLIGPTLVAMLVFQQDSYRKEHRHWFWMGLVLSFIYFVFRYGVSRRKKA